MKFIKIPTCQNYNMWYTVCMDKVRGAFALQKDNGLGGIGGGTGKYECNKGEILSAQEQEASTAEIGKKLKPMDKILEDMANNEMWGAYLALSAMEEEKSIR